MNSSSFDRIVDQAGDDRALALEPDRDGELRDAVQEIGGAVERIDDPAVGLVGAVARAAFLAEKAVARAAPWSSSAYSVSSARRSAAVTKLAGPLSETCRFSTSPKSRLSARAALRAAAIITLRRAECEHRPAAVCPRRRAAVKSAARRCGRQPVLGGVLGGVAHSLGLLGGENVEVGIARAAGLGDEVPLDRLGRIGRHAAPGHQDAREPVLRDRAAALRGLAGKAARRRLRSSAMPVPLNCGDGVFDHGVDIAGDRRQRPSAAPPCA